MTNKLRLFGFTAAIGLLTISSLTAATNTVPISIASEGRPRATIVISADAPKLTRDAAEELADYIHRISGARLTIVQSISESRTESLIWVGPHLELAGRQGDLDLSFTQPEETMIQTTGNDIIILGRDRLAEDGTMLEAGTRLAVSSFIEDQLGVRWFWPGSLGTDIPKTPDLRIQPVSVRYTPKLHLRRFNMVNFGRLRSKLPHSASDQEEAQHLSNPVEWTKIRDIETRQWLNHHRGDAPQTGQRANAIAGSLFHYQNRHGFADWHQRYGAQHPTWFALQPDGTRKPFPRPNVAKICVSNPEVAEQWVKNAKDFLERNPYATTFEAAENDYGWEGYCVCENCLALDNKNAEILEREIRWKNQSKPSYALTDRYTRFWNDIAKRLKAEFPGRDVNVSAYAYHVTRPAPTIPLEPNIIPAFVGLERRFYHRNSQEHTLDQRRMWKGWWKAAGQRDALIWRPNIMYLNLGLPYLFTARHAENMRFMADHGLLGVTFNSTFSYWAIQGPQLYLTAKLLWNPKADDRAVLSDYYARAFGPAAPHIEAYFQGFEDLYTKLAEQYGKFGFSTYSDPPRLFREVRNDSSQATDRLGKEGVPRNRDIEERAAMHLTRATESVTEADEIFRQRVEFIKIGFIYIQAQLDAMEAMNDFNNNPNPETRKRAEEAAAKRLSILKAHGEGFALNYPDAIRVIQDKPQFLGPPPKDESTPKQPVDEKALINNLEA